MRKFISAVALAGALAVPVVGHASNFTFAASGGAGGFSGSGTLTTTNVGSVYTITNVTGSAITGYVAPGGFTFSPSTGGTVSNDDLLFPASATLVDGNGFAFTAYNGNTSFTADIFSNAGAYYVYFLDSDNSTATLPVTLTIANAATPEPSSLLLLGTGALGLAGAARRRVGRA